jgi:hypothetical protein
MVEKSIFYLFEVCTLNAFECLETQQRKKNYKKCRSMLKFKKALTDELIAGRSFRKKAGRPSIGEVPERQRLENVGVHLPEYSADRHDCRVCNEKILRAGGTCMTRKSRDKVRKTYDADRHRTRIICSQCGVGLCLNKDRNCFVPYHTKRMYWLD